MLRKTVSLILLFLISINLCDCSPNEPTPEEVVEKLETAFNTSNIDMMLECYEPSVQNMYKGLMELGGQGWSIKTYKLPENNSELFKTQSSTNSQNHQ